ncbi:MAG: alpha/beta fold hydrolase [Thermodesulfobacteriota bacterium]
MPNANANHIEIAYETFGEPANEAILLVMGLGQQLIAWDDQFCRQLADSGLFVIRFDNRDVGLSTKITDAGVPDIDDLIGKMLQGEAAEAPYSIEDMADDAAGLLNALSVEKVHVCGVSMGGMIAQSIAIQYSERVRSLVSVYSGTGDPEYFQPEPDALELLLTPPPEDRPGFIDHNLKTFRAISGPGCPFDEKWVKAIVEASYDRCFYPEGVIRQFAAIMTQKNRKPALGSVAVPTLVVHGSDDPLMPVAAAEDTAAAIPGADLLVIEGMGHDPVRGECWERIGRAIVDHTMKA